jgi:cell division protein FtsQ
LTALLKALNKYDIPVAAGAFDEAGNLSVAYNNIWISVGDQTYLEEKIMRLPHILPQLEGQSGTLHLENWSEDNTDIVFEKQT